MEYELLVHGSPAPNTCLFAKRAQLSCNGASLEAQGRGHYVGNASSISGSGRSRGKGHGNPLQYSCLENSMDRGAWQATVHGVTESDTTEHAHTSMLWLLRATRETYHIYRQWQFYLISRNLNSYFTVT